MSQDANNWVVSPPLKSSPTRGGEGEDGRHKFLSPWLHVILLCGLPEYTGNIDFDFAASGDDDGDFRRLFPKAACDLLDVQDLDHDEWSYPLSDQGLDIIKDTR